MNKISIIPPHQRQSINALKKTLTNKKGLKTKKERIIPPHL